MKILHAFADVGAEDPALDRYGDVIRVTINPQQNDYSDVIGGDVTKLPIKDDVQYDLGWFHPPCGGVSPMSDTHDGNRNEWPDLIPETREAAKKHCDHWVIENKPRESLNETVRLDGHMFNLGIKYERAFETSFSVEQPPKQSKLAKTSTFFYTEWSKGEWAAVKGTDVDIADKEHIAKNTIPAAYIDYIMRHHARAVDTEDRPDYSNYNEEMDAKRAKEANAQLVDFQS